MIRKSLAFAGGDPCLPMVYPNLSEAKNRWLPKCSAFHAQTAFSPKNAVRITQFGVIACYNNCTQFRFLFLKGALCAAHQTFA